MRLCSLASGSAGNAILIAGATTTVLIDAGLTGKELAARAAQAGIDLARVDAILVTHEHGDHTAAVGILARRYRIPVHIDPLTYAAAQEKLGELPDLRRLESPQFTIGEFAVNSFPLPHDAVNPLGFSVSDGECRVTVMTDIGVMNQFLARCARESDLLVLEANYEQELVYASDRPWPNKQRVLGNRGHLGNHDAAQLVRSLAGTRVQAVLLAHLSGDHNTAGHALARLRQVPGLPRVVIAEQDRISGWLTAVPAAVAASSGAPRPATEKSVPVIART